MFGRVLVMNALMVVMVIVVVVGGEDDKDDDEAGDGEGVVFCAGQCGGEGGIGCKRSDDGWAGEDSADSEYIFSFVSIRSDGLTCETFDNDGRNGVCNNS